MPDLDPQTFIAELTRRRVLAIVRGSDPQAAQRAALAVLAGGIRLVEIALTTPDALGIIERVRAALPTGARVGAGTVLSAGEVRDVIAAGAEFVVTPGAAPSVAEAARLGIPTAVGALTPSEVYRAWQDGATAVKLFPASAMGASYVAALRAPFPEIPLVAVGGVGIDDAGAYITAGAVAIGVGGPLMGDSVRGGDLDALRARARRYAALSASRS